MRNFAVSLAIGLFSFGPIVESAEGHGHPVGSLTKELISTSAFDCRYPSTTVVRKSYRNTWITYEYKYVKRNSQYYRGFISKKVKRASCEGSDLDCQSRNFVKYDLEEYDPYNDVSNHYDIEEEFRCDRYLIN